MQGWEDVEAFNEGLKARFREVPLTWCPFPSSSPRHEIWCAGWNAGWGRKRADLQAIGERQLQKARSEIFRFPLFR